MSSIQFYQANVRHGALSSPLLLYFLASHGANLKPTILSYLQYIRSGYLSLGNETTNYIAAEYPKRVKHYAQLLAEGLEQHLPFSPDAIVNVPSTRDLNEPYFNAIKEWAPKATNLSSSVNRYGRVKSGEGATLCQIYDDSYLQNIDSLADIRSLLMVDDVFTSGNTVVAMLLHMKKMRLPESAQIAVASPLRVELTSSNRE